MQLQRVSDAGNRSRAAEDFEHRKKVGTGGTARDCDTSGQQKFGVFSPERGGGFS